MSRGRVHLGLDGLADELGVARPTARRRRRGKGAVFMAGGSADRGRRGRARRVSAACRRRRCRATRGRASTARTEGPGRRVAPRRRHARRRSITFRAEDCPRQAPFRSSTACPEGRALRGSVSEAAEKDAGNAEDEARRLPRIKAFPKNERTVGEVSGDAGGDEDGISHRSRPEAFKPIKSRKLEIPAEKKGQDAGHPRPKGEIPDFPASGRLQPPSLHPLDGDVGQRRQQKAGIDGKRAMTEHSPAQTRRRMERVMAVR